MRRELIIPELGEGIDRAQIVSIPVAAGDTVAKGQTMLEIETGKAVLELPSDYDGTIEQLLVSQGDECGAGTVFAILKSAEDAAGGGESTPTKHSAAADQSQKNRAQASSDQDDAPAPPPQAPPLAAAEKEKHEDQDKAAVTEQAPKPERRAAATQAKRDGAQLRHVPAAPSVRRFARELGVDVDTVKGSGAHGRVSLDDVKRHVRERQGAVATAGGIPIPPLPDFSRWGAVREERMSGIRAATAEHVSQSWINTPRVTHFDEADISRLEELRRRYAHRAEGSGGKLTMAVMVVKAVALALKKFPAFNASVDMAARRIIYKEYVNIGIAVATGRGLMVPVIRDADKKNMVRIAGEIGVIAAKCREGKITPAELQGGTFTVTNLGAIGGSHFTPIVNFPEVAILGLGRSAERLVPADGAPLVKTFLPLSLSYDHRVIDGADAARFVTWIVEAIQEPLILALEG